MPRVVVSGLAWNDAVGMLAAHEGRMFVRDSVTGCVGATSWFDTFIAEKLLKCFKSDPDQKPVSAEVTAFRHRCLGLLTREEEHELPFLGRRIRGEIFFARRWVLVEGQSEYILLHAMARAFDHPLDRHGVAVIDFQNNGDAAVYPALATSFGIPWHMLTDGDDEASRFRKQLTKRGFRDAELAGRLTTLTPPNDLEGQLLADGHGPLLRSILAEVTNSPVLTCSDDELVGRLRKRKLGYMGRLAVRVEADVTLAQGMPAPFVDVIRFLKGAA